jgi:hypothetical protein
MTFRAKSKVAHKGGSDALRPLVHQPSPKRCAKSFEMPLNGYVLGFCSPSLGLRWLVTKIRLPRVSAFWTGVAIGLHCQFLRQTGAYGHQLGSTTHAHPFDVSKLVELGYQRCIALVVCVTNAFSPLALQSSRIVKCLRHRGLKSGPKFRIKLSSSKQAGSALAHAASSGCIRLAVTFCHQSKKIVNLLRSKFSGRMTARLNFWSDVIQAGSRRLWCGWRRLGAFEQMRKVCFGDQRLQLRHVHQRAKKIMVCHMVTKIMRCKKSQFHLVKPILSDRADGHLHTTRRMPNRKLHQAVADNFFKRMFFHAPDSFTTRINTQ